MSRKFDAIVIGSGAGSLTAGALFARSGRRVLVLERNLYFGGAAATYNRNTEFGTFTIEGTLHQIDGLDAADPKLSIYRTLGLTEDLDFVPTPDFYEVHSRVLGAPFVLPFGLDAALAATSERFPAHREALREYFDILRAGRKATEAFTRRDDGLWPMLTEASLPWEQWPLMRDRHASLGSVLDRLFGSDEAVKIAIVANLLYYTEDPYRLQFAFFAPVHGSFQVGGNFVKGGSQRLTERLAAIIEAAGGTAERGRNVTEILLDRDGRAIGVAHEKARVRPGADRDRREEFAPVLFANAAPQVLAECLPPERREAFLAPYAGRTPSLSLFSIALGLARKPSEFGMRHYTTVVLPDWMTSLADARFAAALLKDPPGERMPPLCIANYSTIDAGLNDGPPYLLNLCGTDRLENWEGLGADEYDAHRDRWMDSIIAALDRQFPGIGNAVAYREMATARTMKNYMNTPAGAVYGFDPVPIPPEALKQPPPGARTAIEGLWLASAFVLFGGFTGAALGGAAAVRQALAHERERRRG